MPPKLNNQNFFTHNLIARTAFRLNTAYEFMESFKQYNSAAQSQAVVVLQ